MHSISSVHKFLIEVTSRLVGLEKVFLMVDQMSMPLIIYQKYTNKHPLESYLVSMIITVYLLSTMGAICVKETEQQILVKDQNATIFRIIKEEATKLKEDYDWAALLATKHKSINKAHLFLPQYELQILRLKRDNPSIYATLPLEKQPTIVPEEEGSIVQNFKNSCIVAEDQLHNNPNTNGLLGSPTKPLLDDLSFNEKANRNPSIVMQMSIIYKSQFLEQGSFNQSVKKFLKWSQMAQEHLNNGFLIPLYKVFAASLKQLIHSQKEQRINILLANINDNCTKFINLMIQLYMAVYSLDVMRKQPHGDLFKYQNLFNCIMANLFRRFNLNAVLRDVLLEKFKGQIEKLREKMRHLQTKPISYFQISAEFIPTKGQLESYKEDQRSQSQTLSIEPKHRVFEGTIQRLVEVSKADTPIGKVKQIIKASKQMAAEIGSFYEQMGKQPPQLDPDTISSIMMYAVAQSNNPQLIVDVAMIEDFSTRNCMSCVSGYYINVIKASFQMILQAN